MRRFAGLGSNQIKLGSVLKGRNFPSPTGRVAPLSGRPGIFFGLNPGLRLARKTREPWPGLSTFRPFRPIEIKEFWVKWTPHSWALFILHNRLPLKAPTPDPATQNNHPSIRKTDSETVKFKPGLDNFESRISNKECRISKGKRPTLNGCEAH